MLNEITFSRHWGVNRLADRLSQPPEYYYTLRNCYVSKQNFVLQRNGTDKITVSAIQDAKLRKLFEYENSAGGRTIIGRAGTEWARKNGTGWTTLDGSRGDDAYAQCCQYDNYFIMTDGGRARKSNASWTVTNMCEEYVFTVSGITTKPVAGATYTNNGVTFTVTYVDIASTSGTITATGVSDPEDSGTLTKATGTGDATISFSAMYYTTPEHVGCCHVHNYRIVINDNDNPMDVYLSKVGEISFDTSTDDAIILNLSKVVPAGDIILGYSTYLTSYLVIWMRRHIVVYDVPTTYDSIALKQVIRTGTVSYDGILYTDRGDILYPSESGYKSFVQSFATTSILDIKDESALINPYYRSALDSVADPRDICGIYYRALNHAYFTLPFSTGVEIWIMSDDLKEISGGAGNIAGCFTEIDARSFLQTKDRKIYFGDSSGYLWQMDTGTDDEGSAINFYAEKTALNLGNPGIHKKPCEWEALLDASASLTATITYSYDTSVVVPEPLTKEITIPVSVSYWDVSYWDVSYWDMSANAIYRTRDLIGHGKMMNIAISHGSLGAILKFPYFTIRFFNLGADA